MFLGMCKLHIWTESMSESIQRRNQDGCRESREYAPETSKRGSTLPSRQPKPTMSAQED